MVPTIVCFFLAAACVLLNLIKVKLSLSFFLHGKEIDEKEKEEDRRKENERKRNIRIGEMAISSLPTEMEREG